MEQRVSLITLAVADLDRARAFYEALGWRPATKEGLGIVAFDLHGATLALYPRADFERDVGAPLAATGVSPVALAYNVREKDQVAEVLAEAERAGGRVLNPAEDTFWGGRSGYFADPEGHLWEVAWTRTPRSARAANSSGTARRARKVAGDVAGRSRWLTSGGRRRSIGRRRTAAPYASCGR